MSEAKAELVRSWLQKASDDLAVARLIAEQGTTFSGTVLYHCQQAAEKALKGYLVYWDQVPPRTHHLMVLLEKAAEIEPPFLGWEDCALNLTPYATQYRYPMGVADETTLEDIEEALDDAEIIYRQVLNLLPPNQP